nr:hypothetical protein [Actinomycetales bacterium]
MSTIQIPSPEQEQAVTPGRTTAQKRELRGRVVAIAAFLWAAASAVTAVMLLTSGRSDAITNYGWGQLVLALLGVVGAIFLYRNPYRHGVGWALLLVWAILMIPIISDSRADVALNDQWWNGLSFWLTERIVIGGQTVLYARTGLNVMGLVWIVLINTTVVEPPMKRQAPPTDVILPGPSRKADDVGPAETATVQGAGGGTTL